MLNLAFSTKKDNENFDRRRRCGTTRSSDIWSLGCLFYELLTGKWLFYDLEFFKFYTRVTSKDFELITPSNKAELLNNPYLIDFLGSILIRNPMHRPTIEHVITKFQHLNVHLTGKQVADVYLGRNR
jgi:serine/threonine protein kinase